MGELLEELARAQYAGEVSTREQALEFAAARARVRVSHGGEPDGLGRLGLAAMNEPDCIFCKIVAGELPATIVDEDEHTISFMDINPATRGHALVIPRGTRRTC